MSINSGPTLPTNVSSYFKSHLLGVVAASQNPGVEVSILPSLNRYDSLQRPTGTSKSLASLKCAVFFQQRLGQQLFSTFLSIYYLIDPVLICSCQQVPLPILQALIVGISPQNISGIAAGNRVFLKPGALQPGNHEVSFAGLFFELQNRIWNFIIIRRNICIYLSLCNCFSFPKYLSGMNSGSRTSKNRNKGKRG